MVVNNDVNRFVNGIFIGPASKELFFDGVEFARGYGYKVASIFPSTLAGGASETSALLNLTRDGHSISNFRIVYFRSPFEERLSVVPDTCIGAAMMKESVQVMEAIEALWREKGGCV